MCNTSIGFEYIWTKTRWAEPKSKGGGFTTRGCEEKHPSRTYFGNVVNRAEYDSGSQSSVLAHTPPGSRPTRQSRPNRSGSASAFSETPAASMDPQVSEFPAPATISHCPFTRLRTADLSHRATESSNFTWRAQLLTPVTQNDVRRRTRRAERTLRVSPRLPRKSPLTPQMATQNAR